MAGLRKPYPPTPINYPDWNDQVDYLGGVTTDLQIDATKVLLAQGGSLLSTWRHTSDLSKIDAAKLLGDIAAARMQTNILAAIIAAGGIVDADVAVGAGIAQSKFAVLDACRAYNSSTQALTTGGWRVLALNSEDYDTNTMHDLVTNNSRITCKKAGLYLIVGLVSWMDSVGAGSQRGTGLGLNAVSLVESIVGKCIYEGHSVSIVYPLAVNDYIQLWGYQDTGADLDARQNSNYTALSVTYVGHIA